MALVPVATRAAVRWIPPPSLPGAELATRDLKAATLAEAAVFLLAVPLGALLFGRILPNFLETRSRKGRLSFEWAALGVAFWLPLWRRGLHLRMAILVSVVAFVLLAGLILHFRNSPRFRRFFVRPNRARLLRLALAAAAWDLARRSDPAHPPTVIADNLTEIVAGTAVFITLVIFILGRTGPARGLTHRLQRFSGAAPLSVVFSALALVFWREARLFLAAGLAALALPFVLTRVSLHRHAFKAALAVFLFACGATIYYQPFGPINLFEDGAVLTPAQSYFQGAVPYRDTFPVHGWGYDGGLDGLVFGLGRPSLRLWHARSALTTALTLLAAGAASFVAFESAVWSAVAFLLTLSFCPFLGERQLLVFGALTFLAWGARTGRRRAMALAGVLAGLEIFFSLDLGLILVLGALAGLVLRPVFESGWKRTRQGFGEGGVFLAGVGLGGLPFVIRLSAQGAFGAFVRTSFRDLPAVISDIWGLPAGSLSEALNNARTVEAVARILTGETLIGGFLFLTLALAGSVYLFRASRGTFDRSDGVTWMFFAIAGVALRGVIGRADPGHFALYGLFSAVPLAWLLQRSMRAAPLTAALPLSVALLLALRLHPVQTLDLELAAAAGSATNRARQAADGVPIFSDERAGVPREQARELAALKAYLDAQLATGETFFDFSNEPALYFLMNRPMPTRFLAAPFYETEPLQREVIARLESRKPPLAILEGGPGTDTFDAVPNRKRAALVAAYLDSRYPVVARVSRWTIGRRAQNTPAATPRPKAASP